MRCVYPRSTVMRAPHGKARTRTSPTSQFASRRLRIRANLSISRSSRRGIEQADIGSGLAGNSALEPPTRQAFTVFFIGVFVIAVIASVALARRNLRQGRGDRKGAFRLAVFVFSVQMLDWAITASHVPALREEMSLLIDAVANGLFWSGMFWLFYVALEPHVRRKWPERLISWSRVLAGDFRDPLVGRDILIGGMIGTGIIILGSLSEYAEQSFGLPYDLLLDLRTETLLGMRGLIATFILTVFGSIQLGLLLLFVLLLVYLIVRKEALTIAIVWLLMFAGVGLAFANSYIEIIYAMLASGLLIFMIMRFGLFAFHSGAPVPAPRGVLSLHDKFLRLVCRRSVVCAGGGNRPRPLWFLHFARGPAPIARRVAARLAFLDYERGKMEENRITV